ncbi:MAG: hypothetical protein PUB21_10480 [Bacteroidales bacterium]|nr:hypothetical protein [Bacteroidales bacterium]
MGLAFAVLLQLVIIFILCTPVAIIGGIIFYFFSKKEKRKEKNLLAIFSPFIALYTFYLSSLFGYGIIAEYKNTDIGVGDCWSVPLTNDYNLVFIDTSDLASISGKEHIISDIKQIQQDRNIVYGKIQNGSYFTFNTTTNELKYFSDKKELKRTITSEKNL